MFDVIGILGSAFTAALLAVAMIFSVKRMAVGAAIFVAVRNNDRKMMMDVLRHAMRTSDEGVGVEHLVQASSTRSGNEQ